jgi:signal transduction histidine kinase
MKKSEQMRAIRIGAIGAAILSIAVLHEVTPLSAAHWHNVYQHLYYLPVVAAALMFGWRGGVLAGILAGISPAPYIIASWRMPPGFDTDELLEIPLFCLAGVVAGTLAERERKQRRELEKTTTQLAEVYRQLQDNFERMKRAERLFAVGQLSAGLAHEIRNPLASIAGAVGLLERNNSQQTRAECLEIIKKENHRLNQLLTSFLDFARPRAPKYYTVDVGTVLDSVTDLATHAIGAKPIVIRKEAAADLPPLECDPEQLKQVMLNLLINAIQAMEEPGAIVLAARNERGQLVIEVRDEGCGIKPEDRDKIFTPFFTTKEGGTGLGLPVAHQIVEQHGGILTAEENPDRGMTFSIWLPLRPNGMR